MAKAVKPPVSEPGYIGWGLGSGWVEGRGSPSPFSSGVDDMMKGGRIVRCRDLGGDSGTAGAGGDGIVVYQRGGGGGEVDAVGVARPLLPGCAGLGGESIGVIDHRGRRHCRLAVSGTRRAEHRSTRLGGGSGGKRGCRTPPSKRSSDVGAARTLGSLGPLARLIGSCPRLAGARNLVCGADRPRHV